MSDSLKSSPFALVFSARTKYVHRSVEITQEVISLEKSSHKKPIYMWLVQFVRLYKKVVSLRLCNEGTYSFNGWLVLWGFIRA